jgi:glycerate 2-kinase
MNAADTLGSGPVAELADAADLKSAGRLGDHVGSTPTGAIAGFAGRGGDRRGEERGERRGFSAPGVGSMDDIRLQSEDRRSHTEAIVRAVLGAADPAACVRRALGRLQVPYRDPAILAIGKAAPGMYRGWCGMRGDPARKLMVVPQGTAAPTWAMAASHPVPDGSSAAAAAAVVAFLDEARARSDGLVLLLSGGASALLCAPEPGLTGEEYANITSRLMRAGAGIDELNTVRRHMDGLKGGRLAARVWPTPVLALALSDVMGNRPESIASGPASADASTFGDALEVLSRHGLDSGPVAAFFREGAAGKREETLKPGDPRLAKVRYEIVGDNGLAVEAAREKVKALGFAAALGPELRGEAAGTGRELARAAMALHPGGAIIRGGETTVDVGDARGSGGRNQELALAAALAIEGQTGLAVLALGTDGVDGPTDAAGAIVTGRTCQQARLAGIDPGAALAAHDSHGFYAALERAGHRCLIRTGPTGTNINDVTVALRY